ncbi:Large ribosomal subunit protein uL23-like - like 1 [Theobroma cacao]|uniref:Large ribosomal subunit protein uL23m n=1 Tax=Theobroma cacao TaxID=3641 RepID=A0A061DJI3_THECC|nr:Ribosomal protein L23/L15e family protein, putative [Theobroma cacao]WRX08416.1 Large ribosomal subunit protein uL23-like - like 1 [Theobroma cacao]
MASRLGRRVVHFANLPIKLLMPNTFTNIQEIALKTIPSASKIEIKRVLESLYGFDVEKVRTLNMEGKKKKRGGFLIAKPDYKKAYVTLRTPLSISENLFPIKIIEEEKESINKNSKSKNVVEEGEKKRHWLDGNMKNGGAEKGKGKVSYASGRGGSGSSGGGEVKFPWSSMRRAS